MIRVDKADGVRLVTDPQAMVHSLNHAPTHEEGKRVVRTALRARRGDRYIRSLRYFRYVK